MTQPTPADDVVEACADALLCAVVAAMDGPIRPEDMDRVLARARAALLHVVERTRREGGKPR